MQYAGHAGLHAQIFLALPESDLEFFWGIWIVDESMAMHVPKRPAAGQWVKREWLFLLILLCLRCPAVLSAEADVRLVALDYPPYVTQKNGKAVGLTADVVTEAFERMGKTVSIEFFPWGRMLNMLATGEADGLFTIKKTPERESSMRYSAKPLIVQDYVFFVKKGSATRFDGDFAALRSASIGVVTATSYGARFDEAAKAGLFRILDPAPTYEQTFKKLLAGRVDAVVCSRLVGLSVLKRLNAESMVEISGPPSETTGSYLVFTRTKDLSEVARRFDEIFDGMESDGTLRKISRKHGF